MNRHLLHLLTALTLFLATALILPRPGFATTVEQLVADGHLSIDSTIAPSDHIVPGQKLRLTLKIATDTWFTGGTHITIPEVSGLVILQNEQFAANASESRNGNTWVVQRWSLDVFPQRAGDYSIGPIKLRVKVNAGSEGSVEGYLNSPTVGFTTTLPPALEDMEHWVAAPRFSVRQSFDRSLEDLAVGDAIEQEISFEAADVMAMMLPTYEPAQQAGLAAYAQPPRLENNVNRGELSASRTLSVSYLVEAPGQFLIPGREFFWWDTTTSELQLVSLPETRFTVAGSATRAQDTSLLDKAVLLRGAGISLALIAAGIVGGWLYRYFPFSRLRRALRSSAGVLRQLRKPALPRHLNPGSSAGD